MSRSVVALAVVWIWLLAGCTGGANSAIAPVKIAPVQIAPVTTPPTSTAPAATAVSQVTPPSTIAPPSTTIPPSTTRQPTPPADTRTLEHVVNLTGDLASKSVVASGHGLVVAQNMMYRHTISVFDANKELVATVPDSVDLAAHGFDYVSGEYRGAPVEAAFTPDGAYAYISNYRMYGPGFDRDPSDSCNKDEGDPSFVYRLDMATMAIDEVIAVGSVPKFLAVTPDGATLLVANWCSFDLSIVDLATGTPREPVHLGRHPRGIAISGDSATAFVAVMGTSDIAKIDLGVAVGEATAGDRGVGWLNDIGPAPRHLVLSPDGQILYATLNGEGTVVKIDVASGEVIDRVRTGQAPRSMAMSTDGTALYVVNYDSDTMTKLRAADFEILQEFDTADKPIGITYDAAADEVWVSAYSGVIHVFAET